MNFFDTILIQPIFNVLLIIYSLVRDFGIALIIFTVLVRLAMWPLVKKQLHQSKIMRKLQPELAKIKKESGGNRQVESMRMLELYKKNDVNPLRSIGVLLIQIPIFIALYSGIMILSHHNQESVSKYTYDFLENMGYINSFVSDPSKFNDTFLGIINLSNSALGAKDVLNGIFLFSLAVGAAYAQKVMTKQTMPSNQPKKKFREILNDASKGQQASQADINTAMMGKMANILPIMMFFIMIGLPGGIALYYAMSNIVAVIQQKNIFKDDVEEMEEIADKVIKSSEKRKSETGDRLKKAKEAKVTRIVATDTRKKSKK